MNHLPLQLVYIQTGYNFAVKITKPVSVYRRPTTGRFCCDI